MPRPQKIADIGLQQHLNLMGVDYSKFCELDDDGASVAFLSRKFGHSQPAIRKWKLERRKELAANTEL